MRVNGELGPSEVSRPDAGDVAPGEAALGEAALGDTRGRHGPRRSPSGVQPDALAGGASDRKRKIDEGGDGPSSPVPAPKIVKSSHTASLPDGSHVNVVLRLTRSSSRHM